MFKILKPILLLAVMFSLALNVNGQPSVKWSFTSKKINASVYELTAKATIPQMWHIYGLNSNIEGLTPPLFNFEYEQVAAVKAPSFSTSPQYITDPVFDNKKTAVYEKTFSLTEQIRINGTVPATLKGVLTVYAGNAKEFYPVEEAFDVPLEGGAKFLAGNANIRLTSIDLKNPLANCGKQEEKQSSIWGIFLLGFAGGLVALLTPCVFPMIPFTVSYFTRSSANRKAAIRNGFIYGFFIFLIYILLSVPFHIAGNVNPEIFNTISTNAYLNLAFFCVFMFFALSFFGFFEITLPGSLTNKADEKSGLTNIGGIFFMSLTLALVSFSCTGPILGSLLVGSLGGGVWQLTAGLAGFGVALGLPFGLFAIFPDLLKSLPKSGGWLDTVKKVLAFVEVALALKFLSNADLVMHWGILKREVFIGIWLLISVGLSAYLFGLIRLPHDTKGQKISPVRKVLGVVALLFSLYLIPGVTPSRFISLDLLSGFPPPLSYSIYEKNNSDGKTLEANVINDYERAMVLSDSLNKPLLIDFTGWACVNCRKMEENVWNKPEIKDYIKENYILVSLYVDDRKKLPVLERLTYTTKDNNKKELITLGDKWATFESENFGQVSQPYYAVLNSNEKLLNAPIGYTPDATEYLSWLKCAKAAFDK
ncbi:protein-disulfide reductase DsbD family protein [Mucilaginibacter sp.]|jgi:thiol:disulfide interchange protein DsbD|uniref:protein-disulfide reductase DsbD family protein n=1 Tax=Mucilaginibacter sp. TaxID=1882438 RepID=UPI00356604BF